MSVLFSGMIHVAGEPDTGKTMFSFSCGAPPEDIGFVDDDIKGVNIVDGIKSQDRKLGYYANLIERTIGMKEIDTHNACLAVISEMEKAVKDRGKQFETIIWDTWTRFENTFHPFVVTYPGTFKQYWSPNGVIKGAEQWKVSFEYETDIINRLQRLTKLLILTTHLKPETVGGKKTGKFVPDCKKPLVNKSLLRVYLRHNPDSPAPIGLVLKRISKQIVTENGIKIVSVLPRKMKPFTWDRIRYYWSHPVDDRPLDPDEMPDEYELSILDGTLTDDQKWIMRLQENPTEDEDTAEAFSTELIEAVKTARSNGIPLPQIATDNKITIADVIKIGA